MPPKKLPPSSLVDTTTEDEADRLTSQFLPASALLYDGGVEEGALQRGSDGRMYRVKTTGQNCMTCGEPAEKDGLCSGCRAFAFGRKTNP